MKKLKNFRLSEDVLAILTEQENQALFVETAIRLYHMTITAQALSNNKTKLNALQTQTGIEPVKQQENDAQHAEKRGVTND